MRSVIILGVALLAAWLPAGLAVAGMISISGDREFHVSVRDADRRDALIALFGATRGKRVLQLSDGVTGRIDRLQLSEGSFDDALQALLGEAYRFEIDANGSALLYRIINPEVPAPVVAPPAEPEPVALLPMIPEDSRYSTVLYINSRGMGGGISAASTMNRSRLGSGRADRRSRGLRYTESVPFIVMNEYFDPFGRIIRQPQVYYETYGTELNFGDGMTVYPDWSAAPYLDTDAPSLDEYFDDEEDTAAGDEGE